VRGFWSLEEFDKREPEVAELKVELQAAKNYLLRGIFRKQILKLSQRFVA
jgi:hypothetical protein